MTGTSLIYGSWIYSPRNQFLFTIDMKSNVEYGTTEEFLDEVTNDMNVENLKQLIKSKTKLVFDSSSVFYFGYVDKFDKKRVQDFYVFCDGVPVELEKYSNLLRWEGPFGVPMIWSSTQIDQPNSMIFNGGYSDAKIQIFPIVLGLNPKSKSEYEEAVDYAREYKVERLTVLNYFVYLDEGMKSVRYDSDFKYIVTITFSYRKTKERGVRETDKWIYSGYVLNKRNRYVSKTGSFSERYILSNIS